MDKISFKDIVRIIVFRPTMEIDVLLNRKKYNYSLLFPFLYGVLYGINKSLNQVVIGNAPHLNGSLISTIIISTLSIFIACFIYSWIVLFLSNALKGDANINMTYGIVSYSLIPMIIGSIFFMAVNTFMLVGVSLFEYKIFYYSQVVFVIWTLFILTIGNAVNNNFAMYKSAIATSAIVVIIAVLAAFSK